jgi:hypothetical protein
MLGVSEEYFFLFSFIVPYTFDALRYAEFTLSKLKADFLYDSFTVQVSDLMLFK